MPTSNDDGTPIAMLDRVASLLDVFGARQALSLAEISRYSNVPRSSAHRILQGLVQLGWVERQGAKYALGLRMFELGSQAVRQRRIPEAALPVMADLHRRTGLTAHLSVLADTHVLHIERFGGWPSQGNCWQVGSKQPLEQSAAGRALLTQLDESDWPELRYAVTSPYGIRNRAELDRNLATVRARGGVAVDAEGCELGVTVVAAPIGVSEGGNRFALSLCGPARTTRVEPVAAAVHSAAWAICHSLSSVPRNGARQVRAAHRAVTPAMIHRTAEATVAAVGGR
ncbi:IclR family transcriptional regulator [Mycolicibacterium porcinum]|uniref:IclR family transcriptional regulator n=2 Tax=Mycolicibacterium porcinum TaxID=39693 RepID=A0AAW5SW32_9MYCO|nr:helix-turn-helix domain-containing protein [Mycobacterium sp. 20091114027_K0903767]MCV7387410.1 IclR family transcriptional regulator [Mycolicibacterium porcinum]OCB43080.1 transcriptional regulator [Mycolicibacterium vulneris]ORB42815.1 transcriptional regulator [Mycolicibacterium porcinum]CDO31717.1 transcriptional regulator [Mycolicibacterium vulneris]